MRTFNAHKFTSGKTRDWLEALDLRAALGTQQPRTHAAACPGVAKADGVSLAHPLANRLKVAWPSIGAGCDDCGHRFRLKAGNAAVSKSKLGLIGGQQLAVLAVLQSSTSSVVEPARHRSS